MVWLAAYMKGTLVAISVNTVEKRPLSATTFLTIESTVGRSATVSLLPSA